MTFLNLIFIKFNIISRSLILSKWQLFIESISKTVKTVIGAKGLNNFPFGGQQCSVKLKLITINTFKKVS